MSHLRRNSPGLSKTLCKSSVWENSKRTGHRLCQLLQDLGACDCAPRFPCRLRSRSSPKTTSDGKLGLTGCESSATSQRTEVHEQKWRLRGKREVIRPCTSRRITCERGLPTSDRFCNAIALASAGSTSWKSLLTRSILGM